LDQGNVVQLVHIIFKSNCSPVAAVTGGEMSLGNGAHQDLVLQAVGHQVGNGTDLDPVIFGEFLQFRHAGHGAVVVHDLADHTGRFEASQACQIHRTLGLSGTHQYTAAFGPQWEYVAGADQVVGAGAIGNCG